MAVYRYRVEKWLDIGSGIGYMGFHGEGLTDSVPRLLLMPATMVVAPIRSGAGRGLVIRLDTTFIGPGLKGSDFGNTATSFLTHGEWNTSAGISWDWTR